MPLRTFSPAVVYAVALLLAAPVAATTVVESVRDHTGDDPSPRPGVILVYDIAADPARVHVNLPTLEILGGGSVTPGQRAEAGRRASAGLSHALFEALRRRGAPVRRAASETPVPDRALLVRGGFLSIDEGERSGSGLTGFGQGIVRVRLQFEAHQRLRAATKLLWQGRVATQSSPLETSLIAQGALAEAADPGGSGGAARAAAQRGRDLVARYTTQTAEAIADALWVRFRSEGWIVDDAPAGVHSNNTSP